MATVTDNKVVAINYQLNDEDGNLLDASEGEPLEYLQGHHNIVPGLESELAGMAVGEKKKVVVKPEDGYGTYDPELQMKVERSEFGKHKLQEGMTIELHSDAGEVMEAQITGIDDKMVHLDANHPLAGKTLYFDVEIAAIRDASKDELEHGHPHGPDGHHHHGH